jgi:CTP:molybdopterin cytidylyltransferase MocA
VNIAAVVLAAGFSRRLGRPKQTIPFHGELLVERAARVAREAGLAPVFVVVGEDAGFVGQLRQQGCIVLTNTQAEEGIASSIRTGVKAAQMTSVRGLVILACDQVAICPELFQALITEPNSMAGSSYAGRVGIPAYFPASSFDQLLGLHGDVGARELLIGVRAILWEGLEVDIDTEEDLARARQLFGQVFSGPIYK